MRCDQAAALLDELAGLYEVKGDVYKARAYSKAARAVEGVQGSLAEALRSDRIARLPGVGDATLKKLHEIAETGRLRKLEELRAAVPQGIVAMAQVPGLGPKRAQQLHDEFGIRDLEELRAVAEAGHLAKLPGFGDKRQAEVLRALNRVARTKRRATLPEAQALVDGLLASLRPHAARVEAAGSLRRRKDTVGDLDILAVPLPGKGHAEALSDVLTARAGSDVLAAGPTKVSVLLEEGVQVDLRIVAAEGFGAALQYFTGAKDHNIRVRALAQARGWKLNEYGLFEVTEDGETGALLAGADEAEVYAKLGLAWVPPELREDKGEVEAASPGPDGEGGPSLPTLVEATDLHGDLHNHSNATDGALSPEQWVKAAAESGLAYVGLSDHSNGLPWGLSGPALVAHRQRVLELADRFAKPKGVRILVGVEANIKRDGSLDVGASHLDQLDYVLAGVHTHLKLPPKEQTRRVVAALESGRIDILSHPTGRRMDQGRDPIEFDTEAVLQAAASSGTALEIDALPPRLDLPGELVLRARRSGCRRFTIDSDCHDTPHRDLLRWGLDQARRGWLTKAEVLTARPDADAMLRELKRR